MSSLVVERTFHIAAIGGQRGGWRNTLREGQEPEVEPQSAGRIPRIANLMALAIRCDQLLRSGAVPDASALARLAKVSQPRMTQILNLTLLAPDIQERLLCLDLVEKGKSEVNETMLRRVCTEAEWERQRSFVAQRDGHGSSSSQLGWQEQNKSGSVPSATALADKESVDEAFVRRELRLPRHPPRIIEGLVNGEQQRGRSERLSIEELA